MFCYILNLTTSIYYGEGRNKYSSASEDFEDLQSKDQLKEEWAKLGIWDPNMSPDEAGKNAFNFGFQVIIPSVYFKAGAIASNANKVENISLARLQAKSRADSPLFKELFGSGKKGALKVLENIENVKIPEGLTKESIKVYRELINRVKDPVGTQEVRAKIPDKLLERFK